MRIQLAMITGGAVSLGLFVCANAFGQNVAANQPQELNYGPPASSYVTEAAKYPDAATKPTPHMPDGHPDLSGVWHHFFGNLVQNVGGNSFGLNLGALGPGGPPKANAGGPPPPRPKPDPMPDYKPQYVAKVKFFNDNQVKEDHALHCMNPGVPRLGPPQQIVQTAKQVIFLYADSTGNQWRVISLEGRHSTDPDTESSDNGDSVAHWDGDTLVVDVTKLSDENWLSDNGLFHSKKLHVTERLRRVGDTIRYQMTAEDPEVLAKPWTISRILTLQADTLEAAAACVDNDLGHYVNSEHHDNAR
jgi:hypothetical protein